MKLMIQITFRAYLAEWLACARSWMFFISSIRNDIDESEERLSFRLENIAAGQNSDSDIYNDEMTQEETQSAG